jgi:hypothetical protein
LFGDLNNIAEYTNEEIEVLNFYLDKDALDCLCHCVSNLDITNGLLDLNEVIDVEEECKHGDAMRLPTIMTSNKYNLSYHDLIW